MRYIISIYSVIMIFDFTGCQYLTLNRKTSRPATCENSSKTALVEHFFNIIFTEFHSTPPVCVCVQMCADQSTYCYPNGCLKRDDRRKANDNLQPVSIQNTNARQSIYLVDQNNDFMANLLARGYGDDVKIANTEKVYVKELRPDPFKDRYKSVFKYKKLPKVELRYNLREQVKNMKSDVLKIETIDVSKTRWPMKKNKKLNGPDIFAVTSERKPSKTDNNKFFFSTNTDNEVLNNPPRYSKRDLSNANDNEANVKAVYVVDKSDDGVQNTSFSLDTLIDNLIQSSFETNNTEFEINIDLISSKSDGVNKTDQTETVKENLARTETTRALSANLTDGNQKKREYYETENYGNKFKDMIASLSKEIDKQNNTSMERIGRISGDYEIKYSEQGNAITEAEELTTSKTTYETEKTLETTLNFSNISDNATSRDNVINNATTIANENEFPVNHVTTASADHNEVKTTKKSRQRFSRKSPNGKSN